MKLYAYFFRNASNYEQHEAAHRLLAYALKNEYGIDEYTLMKNSHGKPYLSSHPHIRMNLSHCNGMAVCALGSTAVGVDCECIRTVCQGVVRRVCAPIEAEELAEAKNPDLHFTRLWTLKESFVKAVGRGVSYPMRNAVFSLAQKEMITNIKGAQFWQYIPGGRYIISACAAEPENECSLIIVKLME